MKRILLTIALTFVVGGLSIFAANDTSGPEKSKYKFSKLEATETSWDFTSIIYTITDATGHEVNVPPTQITYVVRDKSHNEISAGKGIFVSINDTKMESEEDYSISITATIGKKDKITQAIYRKASAKKLILKQQGYSFSYKMMRPKYSNPSEYENLNIKAESMSVEVAFANCKNCAAFKLSGNANHATLTDAGSIRVFESMLYDMTQRGQKVQLMLQPTVNQKAGAVKYATSYFEVTPNTLKELDLDQPATADKDGAEE